MKKRQKTIALIAHDNKKHDIVAWALNNKETLAQYKLCGTGTTSRLISEATGLEVRVTSRDRLAATFRSERRRRRAASTRLSSSGTRCQVSRTTPTSRHFSVSRWYTIYRLRPTVPRQTSLSRIKYRRTDVPNAERKIK